MRRERRRDGHEDQQEERVKHAGDRSMRAGADFIAVRAMAPVQHSPPNSAEPILAKPCAASSQFER